MSLTAVSHPQPVPISTRVLFPLRTLYYTFVSENYFLWSFRQGTNPSADVEGPFFIPGSPNREVDLGKAVLASPELMRSTQPTDFSVFYLKLTLLIEYGVYLFTGTVKNKSGEPIPNATADVWQVSQDVISSFCNIFSQMDQADSEGSYYFATWKLRGKVHTDAQGRFEVISIPPGEYATRAGHFHLIISPAKYEASKYEPVTAQAYVSRTNDPKVMDGDM